MSVVRAVSPRLRLRTRGRLEVDRPVDLWLEYLAGDGGFAGGGSLWLFSDPRQFSAGGSSRQDYARPDGIVVHGPPGTTWEAAALRDGTTIRTLDLLPHVTEFLHGVHVRCTGGSAAPGEVVRIALKTHGDGFLLPRNAIADFFFGVVEDPQGELRFMPVPEDRYWNFQPRGAALRILQSNGIAVASGPPERVQVVCPSESDGRVVAQVNVTDRHGNPIRANTVERTVRGAVDSVTVRVGEVGGRSNPVRVNGPPRDGFRLYWGDLHGMMFNHRPLADYFAWARDVARLDWAGGQLFSYITCVAETWQAFKTAWREYNQPGRFVSLPSAECGTQPDGSHRHWFLPDVEDQAPIFCEERRAAADPLLRAKFEPGTVVCEDYRALYREVYRRGGFVHGHFHTRFYEGETLAEICQKQVHDPAVEEAKINRALRAGARLGIVGGSDTHDSRPANPFPEPGNVSQPAGLTGVWADRLERGALFDAFHARRCYATTGQRLLLDVRINGAWMGSTAPPDARGGYLLSAEIVGTAEIDRVEVVVNGTPRSTHAPGRQHVLLTERVELLEPPGAPSVLPYCYLRVHQRDGARAWSSPIWLAPAS